jgi:predicted nucleic acid-binding protein
VKHARIAYLDSSVLVKRYVREAGSIEAAKLMARHRVATSSLAGLEIASALVRRAADLSRGDLEDSLTALRQDEARWLAIEVTSSVVELARQVIGESRLRCRDAIHVASAVTLQRETGTRLLFVTADRDQQKAATLCGMATLLVGEAGR